MLTDRGRWVLAVGGLTYIVAWAFGSEALYPVAVGLVLAVAAAAIWVRFLRRPMSLRPRDRPRRARGRRRRPGLGRAPGRGQAPATSLLLVRADRAARRPRDRARPAQRPPARWLHVARRPAGPVPDRVGARRDRGSVRARAGRRRASEARVAARLPAARRREPALLGRGPPHAGRSRACSCGVRPASSSTPCASTTRASRCAGSTGRRRLGADT